MRLLGESSKRVTGGIGDIGTRRSFERFRDRLRQPGPLDKMNAEPAEHGRSHALGMRHRSAAP
jgi:hypothetical protein